MYRRSKFQELLIEIRQEMAREADFDTDLFVELSRRSAEPMPGSDKIADADRRINEDSMRLSRRTYDF